MGLIPQEGEEKIGSFVIFSLFLFFLFFLFFSAHRAQKGGNVGSVNLAKDETCIEKE